MPMQQQVNPQAQKFIDNATSALAGSDSTMVRKPQQRQQTDPRNAAITRRLANMKR